MAEHERLLSVVDEEFGIDDFDKTQLKCYIHKGDALKKSPIWLHTSKYVLTRCKSIKVSGIPHETNLYEILEEGISATSVNLSCDFHLIKHDFVSITNGKCMVHEKSKTINLRIVTFDFIVYECRKKI